MATDAQCLGLRAVFEERDFAETGVDLADLVSAFSVLDAVFKVAWAISDPETLRLEAEFRSRFPHGSGGEALVLRRFPPAAPVPLPTLRSLRMQSSLELLAEIPSEFLCAGGAVAAFSVLVERVLNFPLRIQVQQEKLRADKAAWEAARTRSEFLVISQQAEALKALQSGTLEIQNLQLVDTGDDQHQRRSVSTS
jgi:hypothetical protein